MNAEVPNVVWQRLCRVTWQLLRGSFAVVLSAGAGGIAEHSYCLPLRVGQRQVRDLVQTAPEPATTLSPRSASLCLPHGECDVTMRSLMCE